MQPHLTEPARKLSQSGPRIGGEGAYPALGVMQKSILDLRKPGGKSRIRCLRLVAGRLRAGGELVEQSPLQPRARPEKPGPLPLSGERQADDLGPGVPRPYY